MTEMAACPEAEDAVVANITCDVATMDDMVSPAGIEMPVIACPALIPAVVLNGSETNRPPPARRILVC